MLSHYPVPRIEDTYQNAFLDGSNSMYVRSRIFLWNCCSVFHSILPKIHWLQLPALFPEDAQQFSLMWRLRDFDSFVAVVESGFLEPTFYHFKNYLIAEHWSAALRVAGARSERRSGLLPGALLGAPLREMAGALPGALRSDLRSGIHRYQQKIKGKIEKICKNFALRA